jgi:hypothetical protein
MMANIDYGDAYRSVSGYRFSDTVTEYLSSSGWTFLATLLLQQE